MKIKRFFAPDMRQAIRKVREEQGPDAVILSNRRVEGGIEIIAAVDYDEETLHEALQRSEQAATPQGRPVRRETPRHEALWGQEPPREAPRHEALWGQEPPREAPRHEALWGQEPPREAPRRPIPEPAAPRRSPPRTQVNEALLEPLRPPVEEPRPARPSENIWSLDPVLVEMRREISSLRGLLENQLSGLAWGEMARRQPARVDLLRRLTALGLGTALCRQLADSVAATPDAEHAWRQSLALLTQRLPVANDEILTHGGVVALIGPTGVGKTTTVAKLAARFALRHGHRQIALVTTDSYRIGAHEQLRTYGQILGVPVQVASDREELRAALNSLYDRKLVLIDTAGMSQRDMRLTEQFCMLDGGAPLIKSYLVLSATAQAAVLDETIRAFRHVELAGGILTKVDEAAGLGGALSAFIQHQLPVAYVSDGQRVPEDIHAARAHSLISRMTTLMQQSSQTPEEEESLALAFGGMAANVHV